MEIIAIILSALCLVLLIVLLLKSGKTDASTPIIEAMRGLLQNELKENRTELSAKNKNYPQSLIATTTVA